MLIIETSLNDMGEYSLARGGQFEIRHDYSQVITEGDFKTLEDSEHFTKVSLANGSAKVSVRSVDAKVKLTASKN